MSLPSYMRELIEARAEIERLKIDCRDQKKFVPIEVPTDQLIGEYGLKAACEIERIYKLYETENARLREADKARVTVHEAEIRRLGIAMGEQADEIERLRALLGKLHWKSIDKDNMEFRCDTNCYVIDEIRAALAAKDTTP